MISLPVHTDHQCAQQSFVAESTLATFYKSLTVAHIHFFSRQILTFSKHVLPRFCSLCLYSWSFSTHLVHAFVKNRVKLLLLVLVVAHQVSLHRLVLFSLDFSFFKSSHSTRFSTLQYLNFLKTFSQDFVYGFLVPENLIQNSYCFDLNNSHIKGPISWLLVTSLQS